MTSLSETKYYNLQSNILPGTKAVFTLLIAATDEYDLETGKVLQAEIKGVSVLSQHFS